MSQQEKIKLPTVTLLMVDSRYPDLALESMERSLDHAQFGRAVLVTRPPWKPKSATRVHIEYTLNIDSIEAYSSYLLGDAVAHVHTAHALIAQWDSFILNPKSWDESFLQYDYIGAPWPDRVQTPVGNGGFSLRSRRLMELIASPVFVHTHPEDLCICVQNRVELESKHGIRFAPVELARRFAFELEPPSNAFGFHGLYNFQHAMPQIELLAWLAKAPETVIHSRSARALAKGSIRAGYYDAARYILKRRLKGTTGERLDALKLLIRLTAVRATTQVREKNA